MIMFRYKCAKNDVYQWNIWLNCDFMLICRGHFLNPVDLSFKKRVESVIHFSKISNPLIRMHLGLKNSLKVTVRINLFVFNYLTNLQFSESIMQVLRFALWYICFTPFHHPFYICFTWFHIWVVSKPYVSRMYNDMGYLRLWYDSSMVQMWDKVKQM